MKNRRQLCPEDAALLIVGSLAQLKVAVYDYSVLPEAPTGDGIDTLAAHRYVDICTVTLDDLTATELCAGMQVLGVNDALHSVPVEFRWWHNTVRKIRDHASLPIDWNTFPTVNDIEKTEPQFSAIAHRHAFGPHVSETHEDHLHRRDEVMKSTVRNHRFRRTLASLERAGHEKSAKQRIDRAMQCRDWYAGDALTGTDPLQKPSTSISVDDLVQLMRDVPALSSVPRDIYEDALRSPIREHVISSAPMTAAERLDQEIYEAHTHNALQVTRIVHEDDVAKIVDRAEGKEQPEIEEDRQSRIAWENRDMSDWSW